MLTYHRVKMDDSHKLLMQKFNILGTVPHSGPGYFHLFSVLTFSFIFFLATPFSFTHTLKTTHPPQKTNKQ